MILIFGVKLFLIVIFLFLKITLAILLDTLLDVVGDYYIHLPVLLLSLFQDRLLEGTLMLLDFNSCYK